ncbi:MAG: DNA internalization-related competence protein ComEC/Rec2 [Candidatus Symbiodolus clandestinus]
MINFFAISGQSLQTKGFIDAAAFAVLLSILPLLFLPRLPAVPLLGGLCLVALILVLIPNQYCRWLSCGLISFLWAMIVARHSLQPLRYASHQPVEAIIEVIHHRQMAAFSDSTVRIMAIAGQPLGYWQRFLISATWSKRQQSLAVGQLWQVTILLRSLHTQLNQGSFDGQRWAVAQRNILRGRILQQRLLSSQPILRHRLIDGWLSLLKGLPTADLLLALLVGERSQLTTDHHYWLQASGISHLLAISGLHISLAALFGYGLGRLFQGVSRWRCHYPEIPKILGWLAATGYTVLSGANPPAMRAWLGLTILLYLQLRGYYWLPGQLLLRLVALLLLFDPLLMLSSSFWLSVAAVSALLSWKHWLPWYFEKRAGWQRWLFVGIYWQIGLSMLLLPLQVALFQGFTLWALPINLLAIPWVSSCTMPLLFSGLLLSGWSKAARLLFQGADASLTLLIRLTQYLGVTTTVPIKGWVTWPMTIYGLSFSGLVLLISWRLALWRTHPYSLLLLLLVGVVPLSHRWRSTWRLDVLDVGHGLAVVISRHQRAILYDTGNAWPGGSIAERTIIPYLRYHGLTLEGVILSHQDRDHAGGWPLIQQHYPQAWLRSAGQQSGAWPCQAGEHWNWQGLEFKALWPDQWVPRAYNHHSCTVRISDGQQQILLTGDIEQTAERQLLRHQKSQLAATILLVPHHGSRTSSSWGFLAAVKPKAAIVSVARYNPWHLPATVIQHRYQQQGIAWHSTAELGQISLQFNRQGCRLLSYRQHLAPRWYHNSW